MQLNENLDSEKKRLRTQIHWGPYVLLIVLIFIIGAVVNDSDSGDKSTTYTDTEPFDAGQYSWDISYENIARHPSTYHGQKIALKGKIVQIIEESSMGLRVAVNSNHNEVIYVSNVSNNIDDRLLEDDNITVYGICDGIQAYKSVLKTKISIPRVRAVKIEHSEVQKYRY